jgi:hypothetical protein
MAKRQFSFQNVFNRNRADSTGEASGSRRPVSRNSRKSSRDGKAQGTEEERLGLVKGDSHTLLPIPSNNSDELHPPVYSDDWGMGNIRGDSPNISPGRVLSPPPGVSGIETPDIDPRDTHAYPKNSQHRSGPYL